LIRRSIRESDQNGSRGTAIEFERYAKGVEKPIVNKGFITTYFGPTPEWNEDLERPSVELTPA
jgi:hypothetical protein